MSYPYPSTLISVPDSPDSESGASSSTTNDLFRLYVTGDLGSTLKNNARLDPEAIANWAGGIIGPAARVAEHAAASTMYSFHVFLRIGGAVPQNVELHICNNTSPEGAVRLMKDFLHPYCQSPEVIPLKKPDRALGQAAAVQSTGGVCWIRDSLWVRMSLGRPDSFRPVPLPDTQGPHSPPTPIETLLELAHGFDDYLVAGAVPSSGLPTPETTLERTSYRVSRGETFHVQLVNPEHLHWLKSADQPEIRQDCVKQMENGSVEGKYTFRALRAGTTSVTLILARKDNLAMGLVDFDVKVTPDLFEGTTEMELLAMVQREPIKPLREITRRYIYL